MIAGPRDEKLRIGVAATDAVATLSRFEHSVVLFTGALSSMSHADVTESYHHRCPERLTDLSSDKVAVITETEQGSI